MHVALVIDAERLHHEGPMLSRLCLGLDGEGLQVTQIVPPAPSSATARGVSPVPRIEAPMRVLRWMRRDRCSRVLAALEKQPPDVILAVGVDAWPLATDVARGLEVPLGLDVWSAAVARRVPRGRRAAAIAAYLAPTEPLADALRARVDPGLVCMVPTGVAVPDAPRTILADADKAIGLAVIGGGRDVPAYRTLLGGLSRVVRELPQVHAFIELDGPHEHEVWRHAQRLGLLEHVSTVTDVAQHRRLLVRCDVLVMPERSGEMRSLTLEAMAVGMAVLASDDPYLDLLEDGETASIVDEPSEEAWARRLQRLLTDPEAARSLGHAARRRVLQGHRTSVQITHLVEALGRIVGGGAYPFTRVPEAVSEETPGV